MIQPLLLLSFVFFVSSFASAEPKWWKGNLHTHTFWSDGDDFPEMVADWYRDYGYNFLALSDHNVVLAGEKWIAVTNKARERALGKYLERFGTNWVEVRTLESTQQVRLKTLIEFRRLFEEPNRFLMIASEEISDEFKKAPIHVNATNLRDLIKPQKGTSVVDVIQRNVDAVFEQREATGQPMFPHVNHPNFGWALTAEDLMHVRNDRFFEVYNGHPQVHNFGRTNYPSVERMWDIMLSFRLAELGLGVLYALAVDDSHHYHSMSISNSNPGRGWIMLRAPELSARAIIEGMERGDFYASSGVRLKDIRATEKNLTIEVEPEKGVKYTIQFIGTRKNFDRRSEEGSGDGKYRVSRKYSDDIGQVLLERKGKKATYRFKGEELYVRAKVISTKPKANPYAKGETEAAWVQPVVMTR